MRDAQQHMREKRMKKELKDLPLHIQQELAAIEAMRDEDIDLSDIPERRDFSGGVRGKFYRPVKEQVTLRLDADVLDWFKAQTSDGKGYQTKINATLRRAFEQDMRKAG